MSKLIRAAGIVALAMIPFNWALWTAQGPGWVFGAFVLGFALLIGFVCRDLSSKSSNDSDGYVIAAFVALMLNTAMLGYHAKLTKAYGWPSTITEVREVDAPLIADEQPDTYGATAFVADEKRSWALDLLGVPRESLYPTAVKGKLLFLYKSGDRWQVVSPDGATSLSFELEHDFVDHNHSAEGLYVGEPVFELDDEGNPHLIQPLYTAPGHKGAGKLITIWLQNMVTGDGYYQYRTEASDWIDHVGVHQKDPMDKQVKPVLGVNGRLYYIEGDGDLPTAVVDPRKRIKTGSPKSVPELVREVMD